MTALWIILGIITLIIILLLVHIKVKIAFSYSEDENNAEIEIRYLFFRLKLAPKSCEEKKPKKPRKPKKEEAEKKPREKGKLIEDFKFFAEIYEDLKDLLGKFLSYFLTRALRIYSLNISAEIGFEEAMQTGVAVGAANAAVYGVVASIERNMRLEDYNVNIYGNFESKCIKLGINCILGTNIMRVLILLFTVLGGAVKILSKWKSRD
ncbi:MAG: DUF2953 domain-containing protein [Firmicutes bacterium]|nr:DUF2953 domain-containing protein [Bacillota bacterium]